MDTTEEIKRHLRSGDWVKIAQIAGMGYKNAYATFGRPGSKKHTIVVRAARKVAKFNRRHGL